MSEPIIGSIREGRGFTRTVASVVIVTFTSLLVSPTVVAAQQADAKADMAAQVAAADKGDMGKHLLKMKEQLRILADRKDALDRQPTREARKAAKVALKALRTELEALDREARDGFEADRKLIVDKKLPEVIHQRHREALAKYTTEMQAFDASLDAIEAAKDEDAALGRATEAFQRLDAQQLERSHQDFDPNDLPNKSLKADPNNVPKLTQDQFLAAGLQSNPRLMVASLAPFDYTQLPGATNPAYLAPTTEVVLTPDVIAKAEELGNDPVRIYDWVRNNVVWQPTWGAVQAADLTLSAQRGNAFDIASLLIALYRASGIPARYVHGTIEVPEATFRSWMGDWQHLNPAIEFASAGGIPLQPVSSGGKITKVRMEHIWVEAAIDYLPSRGAVNKSADTWVALDASFKRMETLQGLDPVAISGIDPEALANQFLATGTVNETEGWVTGFDPTVLQNAQEQARQALESHIEQNLPDATVGDVLGGRKIVSLSHKSLPAALPFTLKTIGARYAQFPAALQQSITFAFGLDVLGEPLNPLKFPWAQLNNKQVTLSFRPATENDESVILSLLPSEETTIGEIPTTIPAYLVKVVPEIRVDGAIVKSGIATQLGHEAKFIFDTHLVARQTLQNRYNVIAGSSLSVAVIAGSVAPASLLERKHQLVEINSRISTGDYEQIADLRSDEYIGAAFSSALLGYFGAYAEAADAVGLTRRAGFTLASGVGTFGHEPRVSYAFGVPRQVSDGGGVMNILIAQATSVDSSNSKDRPEYVKQLGVISSSLEHELPESVFKGLAPVGAQGVSTVRAFQLAAQEGQRIYTLNSSNVEAALGEFNHSSITEQEIRSAVARGREVVVHEAPVEILGWSGAGYAVVNPSTGEAAYRISGGMNGGVLQAIGISLLIVSSSTEWKSVLLLDRAGQELVERHFLRYLTLASAVIDIIDIASECADASAGNMALAMIAMVSIYWFLIAGLAALAFNPIGVFFLGLALGPLMDAFVDRWVRPLCDA